MTSTICPGHTPGKKKKKKGKYIQKLQQEITRISQGTPAPNSSSRPFRRLRARTHAAALATIRIGARAAAALVTAGVPLGAPHMRTTQLVAHNGALQCNANRLRCPRAIQVGFQGGRKPTLARSLRGCPCFYSTEAIRSFRSIGLISRSEVCPDKTSRRATTATACIATNHTKRDHNYLMRDYGSNVKK